MYRPFSGCGENLFYSLKKNRFLLRSGSFFIFLLRLSVRRVLRQLYVHIVQQGFYQV